MAFLDEPRLAEVATGSQRYFELQRQIIRERPLMREIYRLWYTALLDDAASVPGDPQAGELLELGSGGSFLQELCPRVITSDVTPGIADRVMDGRELPFPAASLRAIFLTHAFHHIPDVGEFLAEAERVLMPGGVVSMIDVPHTWFSRFFFDRFHPEPYAPDAQEWAFDQADSMLDSNQALTWIVFVRDRARFEERCPGLTLERTRWLPWLSYLLSGGVTRRNLVPGFAVPLLLMLDKMLRPLDPWMALHWHLTLRRRD